MGETTPKAFGVGPQPGWLCYVGLVGARLSTYYSESIAVTSTAKNCFSLLLSRFSFGAWLWRRLSLQGRRRQVRRKRSATNILVKL